jgi:hypothetical protein
MLNKMFKYNKTTYDLKTPKTIVPIPTDVDYKYGFIERYFIRKANDENGFIYEIDNDSYQKYLENPYWICDIVRWRITGPINPVYKDNGELDDRGVLFSNKTALNIASAKLKNISLYLPNILQFYK